MYFTLHVVSKRKISKNSRLHIFQICSKIKQFFGLIQNCLVRTLGRKVRFYKFGDILRINQCRRVLPLFNQIKYLNIGFFFINIVKWKFLKHTNYSEIIGLWLIAGATPIVYIN